MATFELPNNQLQIRQNNRGDRLGELWATKNIDLSTSPGKIKLAHSTEQVMTAAELNENVVEAITLFNGDIYAITDTDVYADSSPYNSFALKSAATISTAQDAVVFDGQLRIAEDTDIARYNGSSSFADDWWTSDTSGTALTSGVPHIMHVSQEGQNTLAVTDGDKVRYYRTTGTVKHFTLNLLPEHTACSLASGNSANWVGSYTEQGDAAAVYRWNVGNDVFTEKYEVNAKAVLSMEVIDNIPYIVTERGEVQRFNQGGFTTIATLPMFMRPEFLDGIETGLIQDTNVARPIHPKGMRRYGDNLLVYVNTEAVGSDNVNERCPGGLWEVDPRTGSMWHRASPNNESQLRSSSPVFVINDDKSRVYFAGRRDPVNASEAQEGLWREDLSGTTNQGYFITTELHSNSFEDNWSSVILSLLQDSNDRAVVKYRVSKSLDLPIYADGTWSSTTQFHTTEDVSNASVGDELEVMTDAGAGKCVHITNIDTTSSTTVLTVDEAIGTADDVARVKIDNWQKLDSYDTVETIKRIGLDTISPMIQLKIYLEGDSGYPEVHRMLVKSDNKRQLK